MQKKIDIVMNSLDYMRRCGVQGTLSDSIKFRNGMTTLAKVNNNIREMANIRNEILKSFYLDTINQLKREKEVTISVSLDPRKLMIDKYLNLNINIENQKINCLLSKDRVESNSMYTPLLDMATSLIYPHIEGLFRLLEDEDTKMILANAFYDDLYVNIDSILKRLLINGNGVMLSFSDLEKILLSDREKIEILSYYNNHIQEILNKILVYNDDILNNYQTSATKRKALSIYRGRK